MALSKMDTQTEVYRDNSSSEARVVVQSSQFYLVSKRFLDIFGALIGLILLLPVFAIIAFLIKVEDPKGPVFFKQKRSGLNGMEFDMYKFRSMVANAEDLLDGLLDKNEASGPVFKIKKDPRITRVGKFIRRTSIDELPQLLNVFKGEMSLVGPRPPIPREVKKYTYYQKQRLKVVPGCTCLWQVSGRSNVGFDEWVELDLEYIASRSFWLDVKLICKTFLVLFGSRDAY